jgi:hypothetical protein
MSLCVSDQSARHKDVWLSRGTAPLFLRSALDGGEWSNSRPDHFTLGERAFVIHWIGGWVDLRTCVDGMEKEKMFALAWNRTPAVQPIARRHTD